MASDRRLTVGVAAQGVAASLLTVLAVVSWVGDGGRATTLLCAALAVSFAIGGVLLPRLRRVDRLHTGMLVVGLFVAGYLLSGVGVALFVAVAGGVAWLLGRSAGRRLAR